MVREAALQARVGVKHIVHLLLVTCEDDQHVGVGLREDGEQRLKHPIAEVLAVITACAEIVGLIDKEHVALGFLENDLHIVFRLSEILPYQTGTIDSDNLALGQQTQRTVDLA